MGPENTSTQAEVGKKEMNFSTNCPYPFSETYADFLYHHRNPDSGFACWPYILDQRFLLGILNQIKYSLGNAL